QTLASRLANEFAATLRQAQDVALAKPTLRAEPQDEAFVGWVLSRRSGVLSLSKGATLRPGSGQASQG
ncbi:MAG: hypothetical protein ACE5HA_08155, partial [Anaerolineae bacterium]